MNLNILQFCLVLIASFVMASTSGCSTVPMSAPSPRPVVMRANDTASVVSAETPRFSLLRSPTLEESEKALKIARLEFERKLIRVREDMLVLMTEQLMESHSLNPTDKAMALMVCIRTLSENLEVTDLPPLTEEGSK